jgi:transposase-like protein
MSQQQTSITERNQMVDLKLQGYTLATIANKMGWTEACVRKWWRCYRKGGRRALNPPDRRQQRGGRMSQFGKEVRRAFLAVKEAHPGWGASLARLHVAVQRGVSEPDLPSLSTIEKYWRAVCPHLLRPARRHPPAVLKERATEVTLPHQRWQLDFKERLPVSRCGSIDVLNIRDEATPVKIASRVYQVHKCRTRDVQEALRGAFSTWGLCDRLQTDRDKRFYSTTHDYPFPSVLVLWLAGLGVAHDLAPSAQANGCVERFHRTWFEHVVRGDKFASLPAIQAASDQHLHYLNYELPSQGRACAGRAPLVAYPGALLPRRRYCRPAELQLFSLQRVYDFLASQHWWRRVSQVGQVSLGGKRYHLSQAHAGQEVRVTCDPQAQNFPVYTSDDQVIAAIVLERLTVSYITGLEPTS